MFDGLLTGITLGFFLSFMIGPVFFILIETSITRGFKAAIAFDMGVILADALFFAIAFFSSFRLINAIKDDPALFIFGGIIMLTYGIISFIKLKKVQVQTLQLAPPNLRREYLNLFAKGFLLNFINVGVLGFWLGIIITLGPQMDMNPNKMFTFFGFCILAYFITDLFKIFLAKQLRKKLTPHNILKVKKISSIVIMVFGLVIMIKGVLPKSADNKINIPLPNMENTK
ncbi:LysE family transporter [Myroides marinus]|uniref:Lysine transporter LysE n=1 Tax=Myroides marinus TaxID=703342 RepID=A0A161S816_9FLAO|nr:LysE family transporter [Myroides marinus]KUF44717.1 lysine transporter LysE [Myroides marinus]KZE81359.1 lysine transporter LysE [Myroides marinus]MDM1348037.1 LysE family transporter [Myroides marinus]MDM1350714.1 LysE family transporter [Myroides marinus]MDM1354502.1 LysE family transporter [Myroides marinus]